MYVQARYTKKLAKHLAIQYAITPQVPPPRVLKPELVLFLHLHSDRIPQK